MHGFGFELSALVIAIVVFHCEKFVILVIWWSWHGNGHLVTWGSVSYCTYHSVLVCSNSARVMHGFSFELSSLVAIVVFYCEKMCNCGNLV